jgi:hypothetical protein
MRDDAGISCAVRESGLVLHDLDRLAVELAFEFSNVPAL